ncbi:MAG TPA: A24 family peptidase [Burkholderiales bacterium]|jgi:leader peptidase (prepilin peptidase) / N-methyltransferase|nr:A24 family peptidase [Burkholderiales bacterium]
MTVLEVFKAAPWLFVAGAVVIGLVVGSFLNVVIHRLPRMLERQWRTDCAELTGALPPAAEKFNLAVPRSACPACGHRITALENIPVVSYLVLGGKCSGCKAPISPRYPFVEALSGALAGYAVWRFGVTWAALSALVFVWLMVALAFIDQETGYLPDDLTQPLLWLGILASMGQMLGVDLSSSVVGAVAGYGFLWIIAKGWGLLRNLEAMGHGDFKLLAAIGAWLGWQSLPGVVLISSFVGSVAGVAIMVATGQGMQAKLRFGPYLAVAGVVLLFWGKEINSALHFEALAFELKMMFRDLF